MWNKDVVVILFGIMLSLSIIKDIIRLIVDQEKRNNSANQTRNLYIKRETSDIELPNNLNIELTNDKDSSKKLIESNKVKKKEDNVDRKLLDSFLSLAPSDNAENYDIYDSVITNILEEKNETSKSLRNKNIAITGIYSSGKSSIMATYLAKHPEKKSLILSLGKYTSNPKKWVGKKDEEEVEYNLLQQVLYQVEPKQLPFSEINRIDSNYEYVEKNAWRLSILCICVLMFYLASTYLPVLDKKMSNFELLVLLVIIRIVFFLIFIFSYILHIALIKMYSKFRNFKIKITGKVEVEPEFTSMFRKSIGEFIHFFKQNKYDLVIFEDIDRLDEAIELFTKIKELNLILNNAIKDRTIQFIYELSDSIFDTSEQRTKFFDAIIPIVSYTNSKESSIKLQEKFEKVNLRHYLSFSDFEYIGAYVNNSRIINDIYNEFIVYYSCNYQYIQSKENFTNLFYLICYKVLFPKRFDDLLRGEGGLAYYLTDKFHEDVVDFYRKENEKSLSQSLEMRKKIISNKEKEKVDEILHNISRLPNPRNDSFIFYHDDVPLLNVDELKDNYRLITRLNTDHLELCLTDYNGVKIENINEDTIFSPDSKSEFFKDYSTLENDEVIKTLKHAIEQNTILVKYMNIEKKDRIKYLNDNYKINKGTSITTKKDCEMNNEILNSEPLNSFEERMIEKDYIDPYFQTLLTVQKETNKDIVITKLTIQDLLRGINRQYDIKLEKAEYYVEIHKDEFGRDSFCMKDFYRIIFKKKKKEIMELIFNNLTMYKLNNIMLMELDGINILSSAKEYFNKIWEVLEYSDSLTSEQIALYSFYIIKTIIFATPEEMNANINFKNCVENIKSIDNTISDNYELIKDKIKLYDFDFKQTEFTLSCTSFYNYIYDDCELNENLELFYSLLANKGIMISDSKIFTSYKNIEKTYPKIYNYAMNHIKELVLTSKNELSDSEEVLISVINSGWLSDLELFSQVMKKENIKFKDISKISEKYYKTLMDCEKIDANFNNMAVLYEHREEIEECDSYLLNRANNDYNSLIETTYSKDLDSVLEHIIYNSDLNFEPFKEISDYYFTKGNYYTSSIPSISNEKIEYLIDEKHMKTGKIGNLIQIDDNIEINTSIKEKYVENSFHLIKENVYDEMTESILDKIAKLDYDAQERLNYLLKYKDRFGEKVYSIIADNISFEGCEIEEEDLIRIIREKIPTTQVIETSKKKQVIKSIEKNIDKISNDTIKNELSRLDDVFASIFEDRGNAKYLSKDFYSKEMLSKIMQRGIIKSFEPYKTNCFIINKKANARTKQP